MKHQSKLSLLGIFTTLVFASGCGSTQPSSIFTTQSAQVTVTEPAIISRAGDTVDSLSMEGFDANGNLVFGPTIVDFSNSMSFPAPPDSVATLQLDYLRNHGFALFRADLTRQPDGTFNLSNPSEQPVTLQDSGFNVVSDGSGGFKVQSKLTGSPVGLVARAVNAQSSGSADIKLKGVCYSPAPIGFDNTVAPAIGDLFWDSVTGAKNWYVLWASGRAEYDFSAKGRGDLDKIRGLGANCIRVYSMISRQLADLDANGNYVVGPVPNPPDNFVHFTHKAFLDQCWNDGHNPLYVLVGIPIPETMLYKYKYDLLSAADKAYWEFVINETVNDVKDHPAVLGFVLFNEHDEDRSAFPGQTYNDKTFTYEGGVQDENSDFYYGQLKKYSSLIHDLTGRTADTRKLVGWAAHDSPAFAFYGSHVPSGQPYFSQLPDIDFFGVNTYQSVNLDSVVGPTISGSYGTFADNVKKPVFLTEFGWVGVGHDQTGNLYEDGTTRSKAATVISRMVPQAFASSLVIGMTYFEFSDEWWKQPPYDATKWNPGPFDPGMPNGYHDQEGFGLFSTSLGAGRTSTAQPPYANGRPVYPVDVLNERTEMTDALKQAFSQAK